ncbi:P-loop containing nucleoside triphosphate hydrolase protein [Fomitopsis serialis]|uniref:P-loop containing nucleoside triphosphate hydrolase protein n=1 Tax=Fomitopsis serialis TaxID=139415 RepID=UPI002008D5A3|nr:P-loop containing nucleoside triphosphate hydrolase protein [Neoantrodia serialis]KAH9925226.1 P-loop containing nucleoside triphosphate hydrolase protein [Neoantrodia serialis]
MAEPAPKFIALMGCTESGKSSFINCAAASNLVVDHELQSGTSEIQMATMQLAGDRITLIDTPGFDDIEIPQADILSLIAAFLQQTFAHGTRLTGILYLHPISDNRMSDISLKTYQLFRKLCGDTAMANVIIVTTMWDIVPSEIANVRARELRGHYFKDACDVGARIMRHDNTHKSAVGILSTLLGKPPAAFHIQRQLVEEHKTVPQTDAGRELASQLDAMYQQQQWRLDVSTEEARSTRRHTEEGLQQLRDELGELRQKLRKTEIERDKLQMAQGDRFHTRLQDVVSQLGRMVYSEMPQGQRPVRFVVLTFA